MRAYQSPSFPLVLFLGIPLNIQVDLFLLIVNVHLRLILNRIRELFECSIGHDLECDLRGPDPLIQQYLKRPFGLLCVLPGHGQVLPTIDMSELDLVPELDGLVILLPFHLVALLVVDALRSLHLEEGVVEILDVLHVILLDQVDALLVEPLPDHVVHVPIDVGLASQLDYLP